MLEIFCDSLLSFHFFGYKYIGNKYYKVHNGLIFSYTVDHGKKIITFKCDLKKEISCHKKVTMCTSVLISSINKLSLIF